MYYLKDYKCEDHAVILDFVLKNPLALVCGSFKDGKPVASHLPLLVETNDNGEMTHLTGHLMRGTDHYKAFEENEQVLAVFSGTNHYISASNYEIPGRASTWNYETVHISGRMYFVGMDELLGVLEKTQDYFENNALSPAAFKKLPKEYIDKNVKAISGFKIKVENVRATFKLSQDKSPEDIIRVTEGLGKINTPEAKRMMERMQIVNKLKQDK